MDSPSVSRLFRRLAQHRFCRHGPRPAVLPICQSSSPRQLRCSSGDTPKRDKESLWQQRLDNFPRDMVDEYKRYPIVTAHQLRARKQRPRRVKMLLRDFIDDSLYNPHYGYFSKNVTIFSPGDPFDFASIRDEPEFYKLLGQRYTAFEDKLDEQSPNNARQLWHTPTELFRPFYGEAIARYMVANYKLTDYPYHDLVIYEMGAGTGTLMLNILDYIRRVDPDVYARTKYRIIEVSSQLADLQSRNLRASASTRGHADKVQILNKSIFDWETYVPDPCFFLAFEVFDNFAHDVLRYDPDTDQPLQGSVLIDAQGEFYEFYSRQLDPVASRFLRVRAAACPEQSYSHPLRAPRFLRQLRHSLPFAPNLSLPEYIPTRLLHFITLLSAKFPHHRLLTSDFHSLPHATKGFNAPVVQTRFERRTVPVRSPLVHQGYFDILFPTDFEVMQALYQAVTGRLTRLMTHEEFFQRWSYREDTTMRSGEDALLSWYKNASVMVTV